MPLESTQASSWLNIAAVPTADELSLVDPEIRAVFEGRTYFTGTPLMAQLCKEMRLLREALAKE